MQAARQKQDDLRKDRMEQRCKHTGACLRACMATAAVFVLVLVCCNSVLQQLLYHMPPDGCREKFLQSAEASAGDMQ